MNNTGIGRFIHECLFNFKKKYIKKNHVYFFVSCRHQLPIIAVHIAGARYPPLYWNPSLTAKTLSITQLSHLILIPLYIYYLPEISPHTLYSLSYTTHTSRAS